jgi:hypothetical protein
MADCLAPLRIGKDKTILDENRHITSMKTMLMVPILMVLTRLGVYQFQLTALR